MAVKNLLGNKLIIIKHRCNKVVNLESTDTKYGVEIDLRSSYGRIILQHDPHLHGEDFEMWLASYRHRFLILNIKEEGIELDALKLVKQAGIEEFFLLDQSFPYLLKVANAGERRSAVRVSEFESFETALRMAPHIDWVWVDTFTHLALSAEEATALTRAGLSLCLVSPELLGRTGEPEVRYIQSQLKDRGIVLSAVCTKTPELWERFFLHD